jgi:hypothetical protein
MICPRPRAPTRFDTTQETMMHNTIRTICLTAAALTLVTGCAMQPPQPSEKDMTFFVTSVGFGKGANLGGLAGADAHCQALAKAAGVGDRTWRAYLSTQAPALNDPNFVNARDRIGTGPWQNAKGAVIARNVEELHSPSSNLTKQTTLDEKGQLVNGRTEKPSKHDMLTGSRPDGTAYAGAPFADMTCGNWTKDGKDGSAMLGHHDRSGPMDTTAWSTSWNSSHPSRGCDQDGLVSTGGAGLFYCFAAK